MGENGTTDPRGDPERPPDPIEPEDITPATEGLLLETPAADVNAGAPSPATESENIARMDRRDVMRGFAWTSFFSIFSKVLFPLAGLYVSRTLGPGPLGIAGMLIQIIAISEVLRDAGLTQTYMVDHQVDRKKLGTFMAMALVTGLIPSLALVVFAPQLAAFFRAPELGYSLPLVAGIVMMSAVCTIPGAKMLKEGRLKEIGMIGVIAGGIALATCIVMVRLGHGFNAILAQIVIAPVISNTWIFLRSPVTTLHWSWPAMKATFRKSAALLLANGLNNLFLQADLFVIARYINNTATGLYNTAQNIAYKPADLISFPLAKVLMVAFGQTSNDMEKLARNFTRALTAVILLVTPIYIVIGFCSEAIIWLLYAEKFVGAISTMSILSLYLGARTLGNVAGHALVPAGKHAWTLYPWILALSLTTGLLYLFYRPTWPHYSLETIVWCFTAGALSVYIPTCWAAFYFLQPKAREMSRMWRAVGTTLATGTFVFLIQQLPVGMYVRLGVTLVAAPILHFALIGTLLEGNWRAYLHRRGPRELLKSI